MRVGARRTRLGVFAGVAFLGRGLRLWITSPGIMFLGALPALIVGIVYTAAIIVFAMNIGAIADWMTPFADQWEEVPQVLTRVGAGLAVTGALVLLLVFTFAAVTLAVGNPFYERIWRSVESTLGGAPNEVETPFWSSTFRGIGTGLALFLRTALVGVGLFAGGFIPVVGQTVVPVLGVLLGGWFLALELTGFAFEARGVPMRERRRMLGARRSVALGFGASTYLLFLVPFAAVVIMPAAVAGATLLSREALDRASITPP